MPTAKPLRAGSPFYPKTLISVDMVKSREQQIAPDLLSKVLHAGNGIDQKWEIEGANAPHDLAILAAPVRLAGSDRPLAVIVGETRQSDSHLQKYILLPYGELMDTDVVVRAFLYCSLPHRAGQLGSAVCAAGMQQQVCTLFASSLLSI